MSAGTITVTKTQDTVVEVTFVDSAGAAFNLTGYTVSFSVSARPPSTPQIFKYISSHIDPAHGAVTIPLSHDETNLAIRAWRYQLTLTTSTGLVRSSGLGFFRVSNFSTGSVGITLTVGSATTAVATVNEGVDNFEGDDDDITGLLMLLVRV
jgi:hypothetical protein